MSHIPNNHPSGQYRDRSSDENANLYPYKKSPAVCEPEKIVVGDTGLEPVTSRM